MITNLAAFWTFLAVVFTVAAVGVLLLGAAAVAFFVTNRPVRLQQRESIPQYYGRLHFAH